VSSAPESVDTLTWFGPFSLHDDEVDACSGALEMLSPNRSTGVHRAAAAEAEALKEQHKSEVPKTYWAIGSMEWQAGQRGREARLAAAAADKS
jgi:hypothetical protein